MRRKVLERPAANRLRVALRPAASSQPAARQGQRDRVEQALWRPASPPARPGAPRGPAFSSGSRLVASQTPGAGVSTRPESAALPTNLAGAPAVAPRRARDTAVRTRAPRLRPVWSRPSLFSSNVQNDRCWLAAALERRRRAAVESSDAGIGRPGRERDGRGIRGGQNKYRRSRSLREAGSRNPRDADDAMSPRLDLAGEVVMEKRAGGEDTQVDRCEQRQGAVRCLPCRSDASCRHSHDYRRKLY